MKNHLKTARAIILLPLLTLTLQANQDHTTVTSKSKTLIYSYDNNKDSISPHKVTLKGKNSSCSVNFAIVRVTPYDTDCIEKENSKGDIILCTKDKKLCKTITEVTYFNATKREIKGKRAKKIPFVGGGEFNFLGGSGTGGTVEIFSNKKVVYKTYGVFSSSIIWQGKYSSPENPYWVEKDVICYYDAKSGQAGICTDFYQSE